MVGTLDPIDACWSENAWIVLKMLSNWHIEFSARCPFKGEQREAEALRPGAVKFPEHFLWVRAS